MGMPHPSMQTEAREQNAQITGGLCFWPTENGFLVYLDHADSNWSQLLIFSARWISGVFEALEGSLVSYSILTRNLAPFSEHEERIVSSKK